METPFEVVDDTTAAELEAAFDEVDETGDAGVFAIIDETGIYAPFPLLDYNLTVEMRIVEVDGSSTPSPSTTRATPRSRRCRSSPNCRRAWS